MVGLWVEQVMSACMRGEHGRTGRMRKGAILGTEWASSDVQGRVCQPEFRRMVRAGMTSSGQAECSLWATARSGFPRDTAPPNHSTHGPLSPLSLWLSPECTYSWCQRHAHSRVPEAGSVGMSEMQAHPALSVLGASGPADHLSEPPAHRDLELPSPEPLGSWNSPGTGPARTESSGVTAGQRNRAPLELDVIYPPMPVITT